VRLEDYLNKVNASFKSKKEIIPVPTSPAFSSGEDIAAIPAKKVKPKSKYTSEIEEFANINF
jgi:hypothetical protein